MIDGADLSPLLSLIRRLRGEDGCPWDREQTLATVRSFLVEEAHEVAAALDHHDGQSGAELREELGDLIFQCCFVAVLAEEQGLFEIADSLESVHAKMVERHPHVFADDRLETATEVAAAWERRKQLDPTRKSVLDGVPLSMPALARAYRVGQKVSSVGFDWPGVEGVLDKVDEELAEVRDALQHGDSADIEDEIGDLLLSVASVARHMRIDPERALSRANQKFESRYRSLEEHLPEGGVPDAEELDLLWRQVKISASSDD